MTSDDLMTSVRPLMTSDDLMTSGRPLMTLPLSQTGHSLASPPSSLLSSRRGFASATQTLLCNSNQGLRPTTHIRALGEKPVELLGLASFFSFSSSHWQEQRCC